MWESADDPNVDIQKKKHLWGKTEQSNTSTYGL